MDELLERVTLAKNNNHELENLISDYMPFIKKAVNDAGSLDVEYNDRLSIAMLSFMNCVKQYEAERGAFKTFAASCIRNRIIDESRKRLRYTGKVIPLSPDEDNKIMTTAEEKASVAAYNQKQEQERLADEIDALSEQLDDYGISFQELPAICPKQERTRNQCMELGRFVANDREMRENLFKHRRLAQSELARKFGLSEKTIEKRRKYIVTLVILFTGDYPLIRAFLPQYRGYENEDRRCV